MNFSPRITSTALALLTLLLVGACGTAEAPAQDPTPTQPTLPTPTVQSEPTVEEPSSQEPSTAFDAEAYFSGQTITFISGFSPGGGYDTYMRVAALHLANTFPGNPEFVVQNLPGSGGERGLRETMVSEQDGLTVGILHPAFVKRELAGIDVPDFDLNTVNILGTPNYVETSNIYHTRSDVANSWEEVLGLGRPLTHGQDVPGATGEAAAKFIELVGGPLRVVYGYSGSADAHAGFDRGEVDTSGGSCSLAQTPRLYPEHIEQGLCRPLFWYGIISPEEDPLIQEWLDLINEPIPPHIFDLSPMRDIPTWQQDLFDVVQGLNLASHIFVMPPGVPEEVMQVWNQQFEAMATSPAFVEQLQLMGFNAGYGGPDLLSNLFQSGLHVVQDPEHREFFLEYLGVVE